MNTQLAPASKPTMSAFNYLERATKTIADLGFQTQEVNTEAIVPIVQDIQGVDESKAIVIARTLQQCIVFNEAVRAQVAEMKMGSRHLEIVEAFNSIIEDVRTLATQIEEDRNGAKEKWGRFWMRLTRGSIAKRFNKIRDNHNAVSKDSMDQIVREKKILEAYLDFRGALKEAEIVSAQLYKTQTEILESARKDLAEKNSTISAVTDPEDIARAQLVRDESQRKFDLEDRRFQRIKTISEQLTTSYHTSEMVMGDLNQTHKVKEAVYDKSVIFFSTNSNVLTALEVNIASKVGLAEASKTQDALVDGANKSLEVLAEVGGKIKKDGLKTAYGPGIKAESIKKLVDSMVTYQSESVTLIKQLRIESEKNAAEIATVVEEGKNKISQIVTQA